MPDPIEHPYSPNVTNCSEHDMGDCPYHKGGPCQWRDDPDTDPICGLSKAAHRRKPAAWAPKSRPPIGQYAVEIVLTGDDIGLDALAWFIQHQLATHGFTVYVQAITPTRKA